MNAVNFLKFQTPNRSLACICPSVSLQSQSLLVAINLLNPSLEEGTSEASKWFRSNQGVDAPFLASSIVQTGYN